MNEEQQGMNAVEEARQHLDSVEQLMLVEPGLIETLRTTRERARAELAAAEQIEAQERARLRRLPPDEATLERLWQEFRECRTYLRRSQLSAASKSRLIRKFGRRHYEQIPW